MRTSILLTVLLVCVVWAAVLGVTKQTPVKERRRRSKEIEDKISKLDDSTKKRIHAMKAAGMPKSAIAEKISYETGGKNTAKRIVDAFHDEAPKANKYVPSSKVNAASPGGRGKPAPGSGSRSKSVPVGANTRPGKANNDNKNMKNRATVGGGAGSPNAQAKTQGANKNFAGAAQMGKGGKNTLQQQQGRKSAQL